MSSNKIQGFKIMNIRFSAISSSQHQLFVKEHSVRQQSEDKPAGKTLFVINIPPYATESSLKRVFSVYGSVHSVTFLETDKKNNFGFKSGHIVFKKSADLCKALKTDDLGPLSTEEQPIITGLKKWIREYNKSITDQKKLYEHVHQVIARYDKEQNKKLKKKDDADDEGWTVVTKKGRRPGLPRTETNERKLNEKQKKKTEGLKNFYRFQIRENKMKEIAALRKKHEEDKKKIEAIKKSRRFKPY